MNYTRSKPRARKLTTAQARAHSMLYLARIPYQSGDTDDYLRAVELLRGENWPSLVAETEAIGEASHWVGR